MLLIVQLSRKHFGLWYKCVVTELERCDPKNCCTSRFHRRARALWSDWSALIQLLSGNNNVKHRVSDLWLSLSWWLTSCLRSGLKVLLWHAGGMQREHGPVSSPWEGEGWGLRAGCIPVLTSSLMVPLLGVLPELKPVPGRCTAADRRRTKELWKGRSKSLWSNITRKPQEMEIFHCSIKWDKIPAPQANNNKPGVDEAALLWSLSCRGCPALPELLWGCSETITSPPSLGKWQGVGWGKGASKHWKEERREKISCWMYSSPSILGSVVVIYFFCIKWGVIFRFPNPHMEIILKCSSFHLIQKKTPN